MLLLLLLVYHFVQQGVDALVIPVTRTLIEIDSPSITPPACLDIRYCRQISGIVIGCFTTIFACTWVSLHHNVPPPGTARSVRWANRIALAVVALFLPEVSVTLAGKEVAQLEAISAMIKTASHRDALVVEDGFESTEKDTAPEPEGHLAKTESREPIITPPMSGKKCKHINVFYKIPAF